MRSRAGGAALFVASCMLLGVACTVTTETTAEQSSGATKSTDPAASNTAVRGSDSSAGVTTKTITLSMLAVDLGVLAEQGLAPDIGNPAKVAQAVVADINSRGGVAGRRLVLKTHVLDVSKAILNPESAQGDCIAATEEDKPLATIIAAAIPSELVRCVSVSHPIVSLTMNQWDDALYRAAEGRLFACCANTSAGMNRQYAAWPDLLRSVGALRRGAKVGIISQQGGGAATDQRDALSKGLEPALRRAGFAIAAKAELPCPEASQTCEQHTAAIQRMKDAGVDAVFLTASALAGQSTVKAAKDLDFHPRWFTIGDNVTDTEAHFYEPVKDEYDGAYGINTVFDDPSPEAIACNRIARQRAGVSFPKGSDGYGFTSVTCLQVQVMAKAIGSIRGKVTQATLIAALEAMRKVPTAHGPRGSFAPDKHDSGDFVSVSQYHASSGKFTPVGGGRPMPVEVR